IRCQEDMNRVFAEEARRVKWITDEIVDIHGPTGLHAIMPPPPCPTGDPCLNSTAPMIVPNQNMPAQPQFQIPVTPNYQTTPARPQTLPPPPATTPAPPAPMPGPGMTPAQFTGQQAQTAQVVPATLSQPVIVPPTIPPTQGKDSRTWKQN